MTFALVSEYLYIKSKFTFFKSLKYTTCFASTNLHSCTFLSCEHKSLTLATVFSEAQSWQHLYGVSYGERWTVQFSLLKTFTLTVNLKTLWNNICSVLTPYNAAMINIFILMVDQICTSNLKGIAHQERVIVLTPTPRFTRCSCFQWKALKTSCILLGQNPIWRFLQEVFVPEMSCLNVKCALESNSSSN